MGDKSSELIAVVILFFVLSWIAVALRVYTRAYVTKCFGADDTTVVILQVFLTVFLGCCVQTWQHGLGKHDSELTPEDKSASLMWWWIGYLIYIACFCFFKATIGLLLLRIAVHTVHVWILRIVIAGTAVFGVTYFLLIAFQCRPISTYWIQGPRTPGNCWNDETTLGIDILASLINCISDWIFGILPIFVVRSLNMRKRSRILIMYLLGFASIGSIATVIRMFYLRTIIQNDDFLYGSVEVVILTAVELGVGVMAASLMTLQPLLEHWRNKFGTTTSASNVSWSAQSPANRPRSKYTKADDKNNGDTQLSAGPDDETNTLAASETSPKNSALFTSTSLPDDIPMVDRTDM